MTVVIEFLLNDGYEKRRWKERDMRGKKGGGWLRMSPRGVDKILSSHWRDGCPDPTQMP